MGKIAYFVGIGMAVLMILGIVACDTGLIVIADEPTRVFKDYQEVTYRNQGKDQVIAVMNKGETAEVITERYTKDYMFYKIRLKDGRVGYVWVGDKFRVVSKTSLNH
jgi:hypothetical protein